MKERNPNRLVRAWRRFQEKYQRPKVIRMPPSRPESRPSGQDTEHAPSTAAPPEPAAITTMLSAGCGGSVLLVGFDSAWTVGNTGGLVAVLRSVDGTFVELGPPHSVRYPEAAETIQGWQSKLEPASTLILLDQPTIVRNATGQRPVEGIAGSPIGRHGGGMQPANTSKDDMFGPSAPVWGFLGAFGGAADPREPVRSTTVVETYPCLALIALDWLLPGAGVIRRLPKYNPANRAKFSLEDWRFVCGRAGAELRSLGLMELPQWLDEMAELRAPRKADQDGLDACLCLIVALHLAELKKCLMVGDMSTGYIVVPCGDMLARELTERCPLAGYNAPDWVHEFYPTIQEGLRVRTDEAQPRRGDEWPTAEEGGAGDAREH